MSIFWMPDEDDPPHGGVWLARPFADETVKWIDPRAVERMKGVVRALAVRLGTASRDLAARRLPHRSPQPAIRRRQA